MSTGSKLPPDAHGRQPARPPTPGVSQRKAAAPQTNKTPVAPPVYRPQPTPHVLQRKAATLHPPHGGAAKGAPAAPPVYRPQPVPKVLQRKTAAPSPSPRPAEATKRAPVAPPVYRPQPVPKVLQRKTATPVCVNPARPAQGAPGAQAAPQRPANARACDTPRPQANARLTAAAPAAPKGGAVQRMRAPSPRPNASPLPAGLVIQRLKAYLRFDPITNPDVVIRDVILEGRPPSQIGGQKDDADDADRHIVAWTILEDLLTNKIKNRPLGEVAKRLGVGVNSAEVEKAIEQRAKKLEDESNHYWGNAELNQQRGTYISGVRRSLAALVEKGKSLNPNDKNYASAKQAVDREILEKKKELLWTGFDPDKEGGSDEISSKAKLYVKLYKEAYEETDYWDDSLTPQHSISTPSRIGGAMSKHKKQAVKSAYAESIDMPAHYTPKGSYNRHIPFKDGAPTPETPDYIRGALEGLRGSPPQSPVSISSSSHAPSNSNSNSNASSSQMPPLVSSQMPPLVSLSSLIPPLVSLSSLTPPTVSSSSLIPPTVSSSSMIPPTPLTMTVSTSSPLPIPQTPVIPQPTPIVPQQTPVVPQQTIGSSSNVSHLVGHPNVTVRRGSVTKKDKK